MTRRILSVVVTVLGLVLIVLAVCSATIWKPSSEVEATLASGPSQPYVVTAPGVLSGADSDVAVTAKSSEGKDVHLFVARAADVEAWLSPDADNALPYTVVTGADADAGTLSSRDETQYCPDPSETPSPSAEAQGPQSSASAQSGASSPSSGARCSQRKAGAVSASGSDLWLGEKTGGSSVTFNTAEAADRALLPRKNVDEQIVVMAMTDGKAQAPSLTMSWSRQVETPWYFYGGLVLGGLLVLAGVFLFFIDLQLRRSDAERRTRAAERAARIANADGVSTEGIPQVDDPDRPLTRRELRDKERAEAAGEAWTDPRTGRVYLDGVEAPSAPQAPQAPEALRDGGFDGGFTGQEDEDQAVAGVARGSAVVPGLDEASTQQYRAARGLEDLQDGEALMIASDEADVSGAHRLTEAPGHPGPLSHHDHVVPVVPSGDVAPGWNDDVEDSSDLSRSVPQGHRGSGVSGESGDGRAFESHTAEFTDLTTVVPAQDPGPRVTTGPGRQDVPPRPAADQPRPEAAVAPRDPTTEEAEATFFSVTASADSSATSTTVSWPSYSGGVELPPAVDPAAIQAADAEPLGEPDPTADPDNQEHA